VLTHRSHTVHYPPTPFRERISLTRPALRVGYTGAHDKAQKRNVLIHILQHYPGVCAGLKSDFVAAAPEGESDIDLRCAFGHTHNTVCESGVESDCEFSMNGGGGGCCTAHIHIQCTPSHRIQCALLTDGSCTVCMCAAGGCCTSDVVNGGAGFGVLHFLPAGGGHAARADPPRAQLQPVAGGSDRRGAARRRGLLLCVDNVNLATCGRGWLPVQGVWLPMEEGGWLAGWPLSLSCCSEPLISLWVRADALW
jgi:hypothetical protein